MLPLGSIAPNFKLMEPLTGEIKSLNDLRGKDGTLVMFICNHCPFVIHIEQALSQLGSYYKNSTINIIAISSNDAETYSQDTPDKMAIKAGSVYQSFPYLFDETQMIAKAYKAVCTPDFFLFDKNMSCVYRGQFDDSRPGNQQPTTGTDVRTAIEALLLEEPIRLEQKPSIGCNIKWKN